MGFEKTKEYERTTRATQANIIPETAKTTMSQVTFDNDAKKLWNRAPEIFKNLKSLNSAKNTNPKICKNFANLMLNSIHWP